MITEIFLGIFLFICSITDLRKREIKPVVLIVFGIMASVFYVLFKPVCLYEEAAGIVIGLFFVGLHFITDEKIGLGDGLLMIVTGIFLGGRQNASLIMIAMLLSAVYSIVFLMIKKADKKTSFAFVPFVFAAFLIRLMIRRF